MDRKAIPMLRQEVRRAELRWQSGLNRFPRRNEEGFDDHLETYGLQDDLISVFVPFSWIRDLVPDLTL